MTILLATAVLAAFLPLARSYNIVGMGDSFAAGNGALDSYEDRICYRSPLNWGNTATNLLSGSNTYTNVACSGNSVADLASQAIAVDSSTDVVLLGVGGNDLRFESIVVGCFVPWDRSLSNCQAAYGFARDQLADYTIDLEQALLDLHTRNSNVKVLLVAYPHILLNDRYTVSCCGFSSPNTELVLDLIDTGFLVDEAQRDAVENANAAVGSTFAYFYDGTKSLFNGHEPNADYDKVNGDGWIHELQLALDDAEKWHLKTIGHQNLGQALAPVIDSLFNPTPAPTPVPAPAPDGDSSGSGGVSCFSGVATVQVEGRNEPVVLADVKLGDKILTYSGKYQPIYAFGHQDKTRSASFLQISTNTDTLLGPLEMTPDHMVFVNNRRTPIRADSIQVGDSLLFLQTLGEDPAATQVKKITKIDRPGLYAPLTRDGTVVVNGIVASSYVAVQESNGFVQLMSDPNNRQLEIPFYQADLIHLALSPLRLVCGSVSPKYCDTTYHDHQTGMHIFVAKWLDFVAWTQTQPLLFQVTLLAVGLILTSVIWALELITILASTTVGAVLLVSVAMIVVTHRRRSSQSTTFMSKKLV